MRTSQPYLNAVDKSTMGSNLSANCRGSASLFLTVKAEYSDLSFHNNRLGATISPLASEQILPSVSICFPGNNIHRVFWQYAVRYSRCRYLIDDETFLNKIPDSKTHSTVAENSGVP